MDLKKIIIDTDPGVDDFFAIYLASNAKNLSVEAITTVAGNSSKENVFRNAEGIVKMLNMGTEVYSGAEEPLLGDRQSSEYIHGEDGMMNLNLKGYDNHNDKKAWDVIYEISKNNPNEVTVVAIGPLTNVAIAFLKYPDLKLYIKNIVIMGGSSTFGNVLPNSEFNIYADPLAAEVVFKTGVDLTMVGLNVTKQTIFNNEEIVEMCKMEKKFNMEINHLLKGLEVNSMKYGMGGVVLHDAVALAYVINEEVLVVNKYHVDIETQSKLNYGRTVVDLTHLYKDKIPMINVAEAVNIALFKSMVYESLQ